MPTPSEILQAEQTEMPLWIADNAEPMDFPVESFFKSRVVYYPGCGSDGHAVKLFGSTHAAHCFLYADHAISAAAVAAAIEPTDPFHFAGYTPRYRRQLTPMECRGLLHLPPATTAQSALCAILERDQQYGDDHGPARLAFLYVQSRAVQLFGELCDNVWQVPPYGIVLQDHGFGGNFMEDRFGGVHTLYHTALMHHLPHWLLVARNTAPWPGYVQVSDPEPGGMHVHPRSLWASRNRKYTSQW